MNAERKYAISVGIFFLVADLVGFLSLPFLVPVNASNYLVRISTNIYQVTTGAVLIFIGGVAAMGIAISLHPELRKYYEGLALGSVGFRIVEGAFEFISVLGLLILITLSQQFVAGGTRDSLYFQTLGELSKSGFHWASNVVKLMAFSIGCLLYYIIFYRTRLIPRWLSAWGVIAAIMTMSSAVLVVYGLIAPFSTAQIILNLPMLPQELVLAVWLIGKGFNPSVNPSRIAAANIN